ncbi:hypothetical protein [Catenulispora rubra]|uniref:hypothetical protein n=1 Tax=Catenulispora rubra TaxID=280293 RepID=UPI0018922D0B|nr:hypothetical protein [Catenulispora rubra]
MALSRTVPPRALTLVAAAAAGGTALVGAGLVAHAAAAAAPATAPAATHAAASTLITVTVDSVPALSVNAFQGTYATSTVAQNGGDDSADGMQDPTGVLDRITLDQPAQSKTHSDPAKNWADAQPAVEYTLHGKKLYAISSVDAHAECVPSSSQGASTYVHMSPDSVTVLGTKVGTGKTTVPVTGAQLGVTNVDHGSLEVTYTTSAMQGQQTDATSAHAHMDLSISGTFYDSAGKQLYSGPLQKLRLGDVQVTCQSSGTVTTPMPTPTATTGSSAPGSPPVNVGDPQTPGPAAPSTMRDRDARNPAAYAAPSRSSRSGKHSKGTGKGEPGPAAPENGPALPAANVAKATASDGGDGSLWWALLSVLGLGGGAGLYVATRRRGRHQ